MPKPWRARHRGAQARVPPARCLSARCATQAPCAGARRHKRETQGVGPLTYEAPACHDAGSMLLLGRKQREARPAAHAAWRVGVPHRRHAARPDEHRAGHQREGIVEQLNGHLHARARAALATLLMQAYVSAAGPMPCCLMAVCHTVPSTQCRPTQRACSP